MQQQQQQELINQLRQQPVPQAPAPAAPLTLALHTAQEIPKLQTFTREAFLAWSRDFDAYLGRCNADGLKPNHIRHAFLDTMVSQVLSALGKPRGDARSSHWISLPAESVIPGLENHFFKDITAGQVLQMYKSMAIKTPNSGYPAAKAAFDVLAHEVVSLDSALERVGKHNLLDRKAHCDVLLSIIKAHPILAASVAQFRFESVGPLFDHIQGDLDAILAFMGRFAHFPHLFASALSSRGPRRPRRSLWQARLFRSASTAASRGTLAKGAGSFTLKRSRASASSSSQRRSASASFARKASSLARVVHRAAPPNLPLPLPQ